MALPGIQIKFAVDGESEVYAQRRWSAVPPIGAKVMLGASRQFEADSDGNALFEVVDAVWWDRGLNAPFDDLDVKVHMHLKSLSKRIPPERI